MEHLTRDNRPADRHLTPVSLAIGGQPNKPIWPKHVIPGEPMLRAEAVENRTGIRKSLRYALIKEGLHPPPIRISARCVGWPSSWIDAFLEYRTNCTFPGTPQPKTENGGSASA